MLSVVGLTAQYGPVVAVRDISLEVGEGQVVALLGPNGAGKTTTLSAVMGLVSPSAGSIRFEDNDLTKLGPEDSVRHGVSLAPEGRRILRTLTVQENLMLGATSRSDKTQVRADLDGMLQRFPVLGDRRNQLAGTLSGGEAQQLAIARALMSRPRLLLLDEPTLGLAPQLVEQVFGVVAELRRDGLTVVLVDQNATRAMTLADRTYVMRQGQIVAWGTADQIGGADGLAAAYLGHQSTGGPNV